ncbi:MAG: hypothetical protein K9H58_17255 [Bacteroidales bacterium]|nr:hypothetical protein [Bacteroidales bacterium]
MKYVIYFLFLFAFIGCNNSNPKVDNKEEKTNDLIGDWGYLDNQGIYIETQFNDTTFRVYNRYGGCSPWFYYTAKKDNFYSSMEADRVTEPPLASIEWLSSDEVILISKSARDTLIRITDGGILLSNTDPIADSAKFARAFNQRYEELLLRKGIITEQELNTFKKDNIMPEDVKSIIENKEH